MVSETPSNTSEQYCSQLLPTKTQGAGISKTESGIWHLEIPRGKAGQYRLAQIDDYSQLSRGKFPWQPPVCMSLCVRSSSPDVMPGTWGFGLWNDPFSLSLGFKGRSPRFPTLPNTAWFFFASPPNHLSLRDDLPAQGNLAAAFCAPHLSFPLRALASPMLTLFVVPLLSRFLRHLLRNFIKQDAGDFNLNPSSWHSYKINWTKKRVSFWLDGELVKITNVTPVGPLGLIIWIDNQYAAFHPNSILRFGTLPTREPAWIEIKDLKIRNSSFSQDIIPSVISN